AGGDGPAWAARPCPPRDGDRRGRCAADPGGRPCRAGAAAGGGRGRARPCAGEAGEQRLHRPRARRAGGGGAAEGGALGGGGRGARTAAAALARATTGSDPFVALSNKEGQTPLRCSLWPLLLSPTSSHSSCSACSSGSSAF